LALSRDWYEVFRRLSVSRWFLEGEFVLVDIPDVGAVPWVSTLVEENPCLFQFVARPYDGTFAQVGLGDQLAVGRVASFSVIIDMIGDGEIDQQLGGLQIQFPAKAHIDDAQRVLLSSQRNCRNML
jgi:hypothetical protein